MNELVNAFGYDNYYIRINIGHSIGISVTPANARRAVRSLWYYNLTFNQYYDIM